MHTPTHISYSSIELFKRCPTAWKARYLDQIQEAPGTAAQFGIAFEQLVTAGMGMTVYEKDGKPAALPEVTPELQGAVDAYAAFEGNWLTTSVGRAPRAQVKVEVSTDHWAEVAARYGAETELALPLLGYADFVRTMADGARLELVDLKTSGRLEWKPEWVSQVTLYAPFLGVSVAHIHLIAKRARDYGVGSHTILLDHNKALIRETLNNIAFYTKLIKQVCEAPETWNALPRLGSWGCGFCPCSLECATHAAQK